MQCLEATIKWRTIELRGIPSPDYGHDIVPKSVLPSLALFGGLPSDPDFAVPAAEKKRVVGSSQCIYVRK